VIALVECTREGRVEVIPRIVSFPPCRLSSFALGTATEVTIAERFLASPTVE
jgi:hypothetical protein